MPESQQLAQVGPVAIASTGRVFVVAMPPDITDAELLEVATWIVAPGGLRAHLRPRSRIVLPGGAMPSGN